MSVICPACGQSAAEHAARGQQSLEQHVEPHEWLLSGTVLDLDSGWVDVQVCRRCRVSFECPAGTTGDTLRAYQRGKGSCPGVKRAEKEGSR